MIRNKYLKKYNSVEYKNARKQYTKNKYHTDNWKYNDVTRHDVGKKTYH